MLFWKRKRFDFIGMIISQSQKVQEGLSLLNEFMQNPTKETGQKIYQIEEEADELRRILIDELNRSFVTPIDREDIFSLSRTIDDMIDYAKSTVEEMLLFEVETNEYFIAISKLLLDASREITAALGTFKSHHGVCSEHIIRAKKIENSVERKYREALLELFKTTDVIKILKTRELYRHLSNAADRGDESANIIGDIMIKNA
ncbi:MAG: hypothetical protein A2252_10695 [Elusimicrobia bacterium RIFOXYA2_FULL_39_19]|nr:MAG: hypothetical protein A2252_10695 [Elusimicrobia bacterium RIFOXYA2_FULL_39_19]